MFPAEQPRQTGHLYKQKQITQNGSLRGLRDQKPLIARFLEEKDILVVVGFALQKL